MNNRKFLAEISFEETNKKHYEKVSTILGDMRIIVNNKEEPLKDSLAMHDLLIFIKELQRIESNDKKYHYKSSQTFYTSFGKLNLKIDSSLYQIKIYQIILMNLGWLLISILAFFLK